MERLYRQSYVPRGPIPHESYQIRAYKEEADLIYLPVERVQQSSKVSSPGNFYATRQGHAYFPGAIPMSSWQLRKEISAQGQVQFAFERTPPSII